MIFIVKLLKEYDLLYYFVKLYGLINQIMDRFKKAIEIYLFLRDLACELDDPDRIIEAYKLLGFMLQKDKQYENAAICYKKMLVVSWYHNDKSSEINAYQCLSM